MNITINRIYQPDCTVGVLNCGDFRCFTLELPDKNNRQNISCIPTGKYKLSVINSPSLGLCINVADVTGRTYIRIHSGNFTRQIQGCILVGDSLKDLNSDGIIDVSNSKPTLQKLMSLITENSILTIL